MSQEENFHNQFSSQEKLQIDPGGRNPLNPENPDNSANPFNPKPDINKKWLKKLLCKIFLISLFIIVGAIIAVFVLRDKKSFEIPSQSTNSSVSSSQSTNSLVSSSQSAPPPSFPYLNQFEAQKIVEYYKADPLFQTLPSETQVRVLKGFFQQYLDLGRKGRILQDGSSNQSNESDVMKFTPINISDVYFTQANSTKMKDSELETTQDEASSQVVVNGSNEAVSKIEEYEIEFIIYNSTNESIFLIVKLQNLTKANDSQNNSQTDQADSSGDAETNEANDTKPLNMSDIISVWEDPDPSNKNEFLIKAENITIFYLINCEVVRIGGIKMCEKPTNLSNHTYEIMVNALYLYYFDFRAQHANIFYNGNLSQANSNNKTYNNSNSTVSQSIAVQVNEDQENKSVSTNVARSLSDTSTNGPNTSQQTDYHSQTMIDPYTGRVLTAKSVSNLTMFPTDNSRNISDEEKKFLDSVSSRTEISTFYKDTKQLNATMLSIYRDIWAVLAKEQIDDPVNNMPKEENNQTNDTSNSSERRILPSGQSFLQKSFDFFGKSKNGISYSGSMDLQCFYDNYCYPWMTLNVFWVTKLSYNLQPINIKTVQTFYKEFSFLKVIVLDNIIKLSNLAVLFIGKIDNLIVDFLVNSKQLVNQIYELWLKISDDLYQQLAKFTKDLNDMLNFSKLIFPVIDQEMVQMYKDIVGNVQTELNSEYNIYYNKLQFVLPYLQSEIQNYQQKLPYISIPNTGKALILSTAGEFMERFSIMSQEMYDNLTVWQGQISQWMDTIISNITEMIPHNDIYHFQEAYQKLSKDFVRYISNETNLTSIISKTLDQLETMYVNYDQIYIQTNQSQSGYIQQNLNTFNEVISVPFSDYINPYIEKNETISSQNGTAYVDPNETISSQNGTAYVGQNDSISVPLNSTNASNVYLEQLYKESIFLNIELFDKLFIFEQKEPLEARIREIIKNRINITFASIKRQMEAKFYEFLRNYISFYDGIERSLKELIANITKFDDQNLTKVRTDIDDMVKLLQESHDIIVYMYNRLLDPNFHPTRAEIVEMKKVNLFKVPQYFQDTFDALTRVKTAFQKEINEIPHKMYALSLQQNPAVPPPGDDLINLYDKILANIELFMAPVMEKGDFVLSLFDLSTKYLETDENSFANRTFKALLNVMEDFINWHNVSVRTNISQIFKRISPITEGFFTDVENRQGRLRLLLPPAGTVKLAESSSMSFNEYIWINVGSFNLCFLVFRVVVGISLNFELSISAEWGWAPSPNSGNKKGELFINLIPHLGMKSSYWMEVNLILIRVGGYANIDIFQGDVPIKLSLAYFLDNDSFYCNGLAHGETIRRNEREEIGFYYQFLELRWVRIRIKIWRIRISIWVLRFVWGNKHVISSIYFGIPSSSLSLFSDQLYKANLYSLDSLETYLADALGV